MSLLTVISNERGLRVLTNPTTPNLQLPKISFSAKSIVSTFNGDISTSINVLNISDKDFAELYVGAPITGTGIAASSVIATLVRFDGANRATLNNATSATTVGLLMTQTVAEVTLFNAVPPSSMIVKETLSAIDTFTT